MHPVEQYIQMLISPDSTNGQRMSGAMNIARLFRENLGAGPYPDENWVLDQEWSQKTDLGAIQDRWAGYLRDSATYMQSLETLATAKKKSPERAAAATKLQGVIFRRTGQVISRQWIMAQDWDKPESGLDVSMAMILDDYATDTGTGRYILSEKERYIVMIEESNTEREGLTRIASSLLENLQQTNAVLDEALIWIRDLVHGKSGPGIDEIREFIIKSIADQARKAGDS